MQIWIDADACPNMIKDILFRAATRTKTMLWVVANHAINTPPSFFIKKIQVEQGFDRADQFIVEHMVEGDLIITADIPLADLVITKGGRALNPRGEFYTVQNIKMFLAMRNMNQSLRDSQLISGGAPKISSKEIRTFANKLDSLLALKTR